MTDRRLAMDWLRIGAFALLILYHVGMFYVSWDWHVKSSRASEAIEPLMQLVNPWRLTLLFVISGLATRYLSDKMAAGAFLGSRAWRLLPPVLLAVFVIVPPQTYFEIVENGVSIDWGTLYQRYVTASGGWRYENGAPIITPTYNHMWFVVYLVVYTLALAALAPLLRRIPARALAAVSNGLWLILGPVAFLWAARAALFPIFGETHALIDDWYLHAIYFAAFAFGFAIAKFDGFFAACMRQRWIALTLALCSYAAVQGLQAVFGDAAAIPDSVRFAGRGLLALQAWGAIITLIGFAQRHLSAQDGPIRRYMTEAIFPFYIVHQTVIVVVGHYLDPLQLPLWLEAAILIGATAAACCATYEIVRRIGFLRPLFGLKALPRRKSVEARLVRGHIEGEA
ncbi:MAG: acyltransferase family protein [Hyphomonadaceae bacterium]